MFDAFIGTDAEQNKRPKEKIQKKSATRLDRQRLETKIMAQLTHHQINMMIKDQHANKKVYNNDTEKLGTTFLTTEETMKSMQWGLCIDIVVSTIASAERCVLIFACMVLDIFGLNCANRGDWCQFLKYKIKK